MPRNTCEKKIWTTVPRPANGVETPGSLGAQLPTCCTLGPARDSPRLAARSIASCPTRSRSHSCECIRGCSAPDHSHERSQDSTCSSPYRLAPDSTRPLARASVFVAAVRPITRTSVVETRPAAHPIASHLNRLARASVFAAAVRPITRTGVVATRPARSLGPSQEPTRDPPDHIVSNPRACTCASVAAVRPITRTGAVATRPTRSLSQIQDPTRAPPGALARVRLPLTRRSVSVAAACPITRDSTRNPPGSIASDSASHAGVSRGCSAPDRSPNHK